MYSAWAQIFLMPSQSSACEQEVEKAFLLVAAFCWREFVDNFQNRVYFLIFGCLHTVYKTNSELIGFLSDFRDNALFILMLCSIPAVSLLLLFKKLVEITLVLHNFESSNNKTKSNKDDLCNLVVV